VSEPTKFLNFVKRIGLIAGYYTEATVIYLRRIDEEMRDRFDGRHTAPLVVHHLNGYHIDRALTRKDWPHLERTLTQAGHDLAAAGAETVLLGASMLHAVADGVARAISVPLLHVADATVQTLNGTGIKKVGLLGTRLADEERAWQMRFAERDIVATVVPDPADRARVAEIVGDELSRGLVLEPSKVELVRLSAEFRRLGARVVVLVAPELRLALRQTDCLLPLLDATAAHATAAVTWAAGSMSSNGCALSDAQSGPNES
jgi:aspartate racemase